MKTELNYAQLLRLAEETANRKEAIRLINEADRLRAQLCEEELEHPLCHG